METLRKVLNIACGKVGTKELTGKNDGDFVNECLILCGLDNAKQLESTGKGFAWCASYISWVFNKAGVPAQKNAWAPAWFPDSKLVRDGKYRPMDVACIDYNGVTRGHVFFIFYWPENSETFISLDGNWGNVVGFNERKKSDVSAVSRWF